ncbi:MAG: GGDEF domain-containing protein [Candidatus Stygibacter australis]|nr:GGDEF domain-containing protein [Candidatus Stygibacter australis]MDP8322134.1 GGDEF domain-containing protein [Candidatus Stygibacter australis]
MRRKHNVAFHLVMLLLIMVSTILVFYKALVHLREQIDEIKINSVYRVLQIAEDYDMLLLSNEEILNDKLESVSDKVISEINRSSEISMMHLDDTAMRYGLDFIMVADIDGKVIASTDMNLKGKDLTKIIPAYKNMITQGEESGELVIDRVGLLADNKILYKSAWSVEADKNRVTVFAIDMPKCLEESNSQTFADYLFSGYFDNLSESILMVSEIMLYFKQGNLQYSLSGKIEEIPIIEPNQIYSGIESQILNGYEFVVLPEVLEGGIGLNKVMIMVFFDNDIIRQISLNLIFRALFGFLVLAVMIYLIVYFFFKSSQHDREEIFLTIMETIGQRKFRRDIIEKEALGKEIETGLISLAEQYHDEDEKKNKELEKQQTDNETLKQQYEKESIKAKSLVNELEEARRQGELLQRTDRVTGLPNRETLMEYLDYESARADREKAEFSLMLVKIRDLAGLKNDFGQSFTDYLINKTGSKLRTTLRRQDRLGRWSDEEFLMILPSTGSIGIRQLIGKLDEVIAGTEFYRDNKQIKLGLDFGGTIYRPGSKVGDCLRQTKVALQEAEHSGNPSIIE